MSELDEIPGDGTDDRWVDAALRRAHPVSTIELASLDLTTGFDDLPERIWSADRPPTRGWPGGRRRRVMVSLAITGALVGAGGVAAAVATSAR